MFDGSRRGQILLGLILLLGPILLLRMILMMSGAVPGMTLFSNPAGHVDTQAVWRGLSSGWKYSIVGLALVSASGLRTLLRAVFFG